MLELIHQSPFYEITTLFALTAVVAFIGSQLKQPLIVSFILVGILAGPSLLDVVQSKEKITLLSQIGIALLLFLVGIKLDLKLIRQIGPVSVVTGLGQVAFTSAIGFLIGLGLGFDPISSLYIAVALTFSSTIIIVKLLSDKREINALHGQIALGFLIVQDLVVVLSMIVLSAIGLGTSGSGEIADVLIKVAFSGVGFLIFVVVFVKYIAHPLAKRLSRSPDLMVVFCLAFATTFAAIGSYVGLGKELGGLLAGVALASTSIKESISSRLAPLRDFLLLFFFIALGANLDLSALGEATYEALVFSLFVLIGNPLIVLSIMGLLGYRRRTGFLAGLTVAQISEFSLIFIAMGVSIGHVDDRTLGLVTLVGIMTIALSTYMITYSHQLYEWFSPYIKLFERNVCYRDDIHLGTNAGVNASIIIFGAGRFGLNVAQQLAKQKVNLLIVDFCPDAVTRAKSKGLDVLYGDATDSEFLAELPLVDAKWVLSTIPLHNLDLVIDDERKSIIQLTRVAGFCGEYAMLSRQGDENNTDLQKTVGLMLHPYADAAERASELLLEKLKK